MNVFSNLSASDATVLTGSTFGGSFTKSDLENMQKTITESEHKRKQEFGRKIGLNLDDVMPDSIFFVGDWLRPIDPKTPIPNWIRFTTLIRPGEIIHTRKCFVEMNPGELDLQASFK